VQSVVHVPLQSRKRGDTPLLHVPPQVSVPKVHVGAKVISPSFEQLVSISHTGTPPACSLAWRG